MEVLVYGAENVTKSKWGQFLVRLDRAQQAATTWSEADRETTIKWLEREIPQMTPVNGEIFNKLFQHHVQQLLQELGTKATGPRSAFAKNLGQMPTAADEDVSGAVIITTNQCVEYQVRLSGDETEATTWSITDTDRIVSQLDWEIYGITSNEQMRFNKELSICLIDFEAWCQAIGVQELCKSIEHRVIYFRYPEINLRGHRSQTIWRMGSGDNFTTHMSERLHIGNVKKISRDTNAVNYIEQMLKPNDRSTGLDYMEESLSYLALQGYYDIDSAKDFNQYSLPKNSEIIAEPIFYTSSIPRTSYFPPCVTTGTSFERKSCPRSVQKYQIDLTQRCIRWFRNSQLWTAIPCTNWRGLGKTS